MSASGSPPDSHGPDPAEALLREALALHRADPVKGDFLIQCACAQASDPMPLWRAACKFYNGQRRFEPALEFARLILEEAARRAGAPANFADWTPDHWREVDPDLASQARLALKALAFLSLRGDREDEAEPYLGVLRRLDPEDGSGASVVEALRRSLD